jgi:hypothetical protein
MTETLPDWASKAEAKIGVKLVRWSYGEVHGPCPNCGGQDRLVVWQSGRAWCRQCNKTITWSGEAQADPKWTKEKRQKKQNAAWEMIRCTDWIDYHNECLSSPRLMQLWGQHYIAEETVRCWGLGYCKSAPTFRDSPSLTIPVFGAGKLLDIRHRLLKTTASSGKYRSHVSGVSMSVNLFNRDALRARRTVIVEGAKKAIVLEQAGITTAAVYGAGGYKELLQIAKQVHLSVVIALDPDAEKQALQLAARLDKHNAEVWIASFPDKPDDFLFEYGIDITHEVLRQARKTS